MIKTIRSRSGARITIAEEHSSYGERKVVISGTSCSIKTAEKLIEERLHMPVSVFNEPPQASDVQDEAAVALARMMQSFRLNVPWDEFEDDFHSSVFMQDFTKFGYPKSVVKTRGSKVAVVKFGVGSDGSVGEWSARRQGILGIPVLGLFQSLERLYLLTCNTAVSSLFTEGRLSPSPYSRRK